MGIMDNFKKRISSFSEETVHHVDWDEAARQKAEAEEAEYDDYEYAESPQPEPEPIPEPESSFEKDSLKFSDFNPFGKREKAEKPPKEPKAPKPEKPAKEPRAPKVKEPKAPKPKREKPEPQPTAEQDDSVKTSAGALASGALGWLKRKSEEPEPAMSDDEKQESRQKMQDILEFLDIPMSYEIPTNVLMVQDLEGVGEFDMQMPKGYDMGQVRTFVSQVVDTIKYFQDKLQERNEHIAKLATTVDRLEVDLHNKRFDVELASGVNILPTEESEQLSSENIDLKLRIRNLEQQLQDAQYDGYEKQPEPEDQGRIASLQDQLSIAQRGEQDALSDNKVLRARIAMIEEELEDPQRVGSFYQNQQPEEEVQAFHNVDDLEYEDSFAEGLQNHSSLPDLGETDNGIQHNTQYDDNGTYDNYANYDESDGIVDTGNFTDDSLPDFDFDMDTPPQVEAPSGEISDGPYQNNQSFAYVDEPLGDIVPQAGAWGELDDNGDLPSFEAENEQEENIAAILGDDESDEDILERLQNNRQGKNFG